MTRVGTKGQFVIEKDLREKLGVGPGWHAVQEVRGDPLVVRFEPPLHRRSLAGVLREYGERVPSPTDEEMEEAIERSVAEHWREKEAAGDFGP